MNANPDCTAAARPRPPSLASRILLRAFDRIEHGRLELTTPEGGHSGPDGALVLDLVRPRDDERHLDAAGVVP